MPSISVPWGRDNLVVSLPAEWRLDQVARPTLRQAPADWPERLARALNRPGAGPPLAKLLEARLGGRIAIIVEDATRHSPMPQILDVLMREIRHAGVADEQIEIVFATGMHVDMTSDQADLKLGAAGEGLRRRSNPWRQADRHVPVGRVGKLDVLVDRGVAEADLRIIVSSVSPHLQAGFGGGYKMLLPGCAAIETIRGLHRLGLTRRPRRLVGTYAESNPMRAAIDAGGSLVDACHGRTFAVQYLLDNDNLPTAIAAGDILPAQQMLAKQCAAACGVVTPSTADVLITNAYPRDFDLWQSFKCIANTRWAARPNGVIICLARCEGGMEGMNPPRWPLSPTWTRRIIRAIGPAAIGSLITRIVPRLAGDAAFFVHLALQTVHRNPIFIVSPALCESGGRFPGLDLFASIEDAVAETREVLGKGAQRVIVFPSGGTTFPIAPGSPNPPGE